MSDAEMHGNIRAVDGRKIRWGKFFYCPVFYQRVTLQMCCGRASCAFRGYSIVGGDKHTELASQFEPCKFCGIRLDAMRKYHRSNQPERHPRLAEGDEVRLRKLIRKRRIKLFGE